jgi:hypothetical protein
VACGKASRLDRLPDGQVGSWNIEAVRGRLDYAEVDTLLGTMQRNGVQMEQRFVAQWPIVSVAMCGVVWFFEARGTHLTLFDGGPGCASALGYFCRSRWHG